MNGPWKEEEKTLLLVYLRIQKSSREIEAATTTLLRVHGAISWPCAVLWFPARVSLATTSTLHCHLFSSFFLSSTTFFVLYVAYKIFCIFMPQLYGMPSCCAHWNWMHVRWLGKRMNTHHMPTYVRKFKFTNPTKNRSAYFTYQLSLPACMHMKIICA